MHTRYGSILVSCFLSLTLLLPAAGQDGPDVALEAVAEGLTSPIALTEAPDGSGRLFIVDQGGQIRVVTSDGTLLEEPFLDVADRMVVLNDSYDERGLLGLAFHPGYATNGQFYVYYSAPLRESAPMGWNHTSMVSEFQVSESDPDLADGRSERILLEIDQPQGNHNGGTLAFGPDGYLYISLGDGGGRDDEGTGHVEDWYEFNAGGNAQDIEQNLLGAILRLDVDAGDPYGIPEDNPFVGRDGLDEIYAYGFRNPYRFSFDQGGDQRLFVADAGQDRWEEVSVVDLGGNYGWNVKEGTHCFDAANPGEEPDSCPDVVGEGHPDAGAPLIDPVIEYQNGSPPDGLGLVVVGGAVYRGSELPDLSGRYVFGDWSTGFGEGDGSLFAATEAESGLWSFEEVRFPDREGERLGQYLLAVGQDAAGEIYLLAKDNAGPSGSTGDVYRVVASDAGVANAPDAAAARMTLAGNTPNPFSGRTQIRFELPAAAHATLTVYDLLGRRVRTLVDGVLPAGPHESAWDGRDAQGIEVASGVYLYRLTTDRSVRTRRLTVIR